MFNAISPALFLSTPSARRATIAPNIDADVQELFLSTPSARRATRLLHKYHRGFTISIHALREEGDVVSVAPVHRARDFYPRPPRGGRPFMSRHTVHGTKKFLSTPSARRATRVQVVAVSTVIISIHALREEGDPPMCKVPCGTYRNFYPRPPRGGRHDRCRRCPNVGKISIHALREEGDAIKSIKEGDKHEFLSTPSARRATLDHVEGLAEHGISIHALREEGDPRASPPTADARSFLSTPSARRATN